MSPEAVLAASAVAALVLVAGRPHQAFTGSERRIARPVAEPAPVRWRTVPPGLFPVVSVALLVGLAVVGLVVVGLGPTVAVSAAALGGHVARHRRVHRHRRRALDDALPELVELFVLAASAGHPVHRCVEVVAVRAPSAVRPVMSDVQVQVARGEPLAAVLRRAGSNLGDLGPTLTDALVASLQTGAPLAPTLRQVAATARDRRRRAAEEAARRLPISLLFPLVCCVLPAFGLLAVVPLLAGSLGSLQT
ncbi:hypothetical protein BH23ACT2_BH23ACT2_22140 [soil metagenome]